MYKPTDLSKIKVALTYIQSGWQDCIRYNPQDTDTLLGLPQPYTVPCKKGTFQELYYWDTYFTNLGLLRQGKLELAENNTRNLLSLVERFGFVPNGNRTYYLTRSQPPYLSMMVRDCFDVNQNTNFLAEALPSLKKEYSFWMSKRITPIGLNRYFHNADDQQILAFYNNCIRNGDRLNVTHGSDEENRSTSAHILAECESGWDFSPRFSLRCTDFVPIDLNSNLYCYESNFAYFSEILKTGETQSWQNLAQRRKELLNRYCWNESKGLFFDYDFRNRRQSDIESLATFHPLWAGIADSNQAKKILDNLHLFESDFGLSTCHQGPRKQPFQWDYPNGWAPLHWIAIKGMINYGYTEPAKRLTEKFLLAIASLYEKSNDLWEKYNAVDGTLNVVNEYEMPSMLGWTAGTFVALMHMMEVVDQSNRD